ncbi:unnamed protein product, partial [Iphiclides podalirius]
MTPLSRRTKYKDSKESSGEAVCDDTRKNMWLKQHSTMDQFLSTTFNRLKTNNFSELNIVLGNESCDLDSAVSAIVYAMFLNWQYDQIKCKVCTKSHRSDSEYKDNIFVPLLDVERQDYILKTEVAYCLGDHGIKESSLVFRDDIDIQTLLPLHKTNVILVDHHTLAERYSFLAPYVTEVIDHRPYDSKRWPFKEDTRRMIETVGSCATLVAQRMKDLSALIRKDMDFFDAYTSCADLLHCAIVLDTVNFSKELNKATPHDKEIAEFLEGILKPDDVQTARKSKMERLVSARCDVTSLSAAQLMRKDVKVVGDVLVPSFPIPVKEFLGKPGALKAVAEALAGRGCSVALLLGMRLSPELRRDAAIYGPSDVTKAAKLAEHLQSWTPPFQLSAEELDGCSYFVQMNLTATRKQYMPVVSEFLRTYQ